MNAPVKPQAAALSLRETLRDLAGAGRAYVGVLIGVVLIGLVLRLVLIAAAKPAAVSDSRDYHVLARNLAEGRGYVQVYEGETSAFQGFAFCAFRSPGYPLFLAGLYTAFGWRAAVGLSANAVAELLTQACYVLIAARLLGRGAALVVAVLLAGHVLWTPSLMTESFYTAFFALLAVLVVFRVGQGSMQGALLLGLILVAALFTRPITVCVLPLLFWRAIRQRPIWRGSLLLLLALLPSALVLTGWGIRNWRLFGQVVLLTTNSGHHNAWDYGLHADAAFAELRAQGLNEAQINTALVDCEYRVAAAHPGAWLMTCMGRVGDLFSLEPAWELRENLWVRTLDCGSDGPLIARFYRAAYVQYSVTYALCGLGALLLAVRRRSMGGLWALALCYVAIHAVVSRGDVRLVAPLYPIMCVFAAGVWWAVRTGRSTGPTSPRG